MDYRVVTLNADKLTDTVVYVMLAALVAQWVVVPWGAVLYRYLSSRKVRAKQ